MDNYGYQPSYPDSGDSSPRSREIDFENTPPWEDSQNPPPNYKVKFMCSYGGKIQPRPHDNQLSYMGGETKILAVDRNIKFGSLIAKLTAVCDGEREGVSFKYQLPGEDLDALISVTNDDDLEHMMSEYDRLYRASPKPARLRLFLFPATTPQQTAPTVVSSRSFGSEEAIKSEKERFVEALNSGPTPTNNSTPTSAVTPPPVQAGNVDFLFGLEKGMPPPPLQQQQQPPVMAPKLRDPTSDPHVHEHEFPVPGLDDRMMTSDPIQKHIQDLQRLRLEEQQGIYRRKSEDNLVGGFPVSVGGEYYVHKVPEKVSQQVPVQGTVGVPTTGYWPEKQVTGGVFPTSSLGTDQQLYMIQAPASAYHAPQMVRPMTGPTTQGAYYTVQRMAPEVYRDQQMYNVMQNVPTSVPSVGAPQPPPPSSLPAQGQPKVATYSDGYGMVRSAATTGIVDSHANYAHMAYDNGVGRQMYYAAAQGGVMAAPPPPPQQQQQQQPQQGQAQFQGMAGIGADVKVTLNQETVKLVPKATQASV